MGKSYKANKHQVPEQFKKFVKKGKTQPDHVQLNPGPVHKITGKAKKPLVEQPDPTDDGFQP